MRRWAVVGGVVVFAAACGGVAPRERRLETAPLASASVHETGAAKPEPSAAATAEAAVTPTTEPTAAPADEDTPRELGRRLSEEKEGEGKPSTHKHADKSGADKNKDAPPAQPPPPPPPPKGDFKACAPNDLMCQLGGAAPKQEAKRSPRASVRAASTASMSGRLTPQQVENAVTDHIDLFAGCASGDVTVSLHAVIAGTGKVSDASAARSAPDEARIRDCVVTAFKGIQFPASSDGKSVPIEFDLVLSPSS